MMGDSPFMCMHHEKSQSMQAIFLWEVTFEVQRYVIIWFFIDPHPFSALSFTEKKMKTITKPNKYKTRCLGFHVML